MALNIEHFLRVRPYLYHLTARRNYPVLSKDWVLKSANSLFDAAGQTGYRKLRRKGHLEITLGAISLTVRDQDRLYKGNMVLTDGWTFEGFVEHLNDHVFFWPGSGIGPVSSGQRHFERYAAEKPIVMRIPTADLFEANIKSSPHFCKYNSGAPRCHDGEGIPRGPNTFLKSIDFHFPPTSVVEVTFKSAVCLPLTLEVSNSPSGPWESCNDFKH